MKKLLLPIVGVAILAVVLFIMFGSGDQGTDSYTVAETFSEDTTVDNNYVIAEKSKAIVKSGATLTVNGDLEVRGALECEGGPLNVVVRGNLTVEDTIRCDRADDIAEGDLGNGIVFVVEGFVAFGENATVISNGHVQIVDNQNDVLRTQEEIDEAYEEVAQDTGDIPRIGPFVPEEEIALHMRGVSSSLYSAAVSRFGHLLGEEVSAQATDEKGNAVRTVRIGGKWYVGNPGQNPPRGLNIPTPPKNIKKILIRFNFGPGAQVNLQNFSLVGPDGRDGESSLNESCSAKGEDGNNAMRFRVRASNIRVNNFTLLPGDGGTGGEAVTKNDCYPKGVATGGNGGNAGNIKMEASGTFEVQGAFIVHPGFAGNGGEAIASARDGKDQCPGEPGGEAVATGGNGGDNKKKLTIINVQGANNIQIGDILGGDGGAATANPGKGGNGTASDCDGGAGGKATATGGKGGDTSLSGAGVGRTGGATETGGDGGDATATGANGGNGGAGSQTTPGGDGGKGGDAQPAKGAGGSATVTGNPGTENEKGGNGGNGGDGCLPGSGGDKGLGLTLGNHGADGEDGKNLCPSPPPPSATIQVIQYQDYYIPIDQLILVPSHLVDEFGGCEEEHWHAEGEIMTTNGMIMYDPNPSGCGLGTRSQTPVMEIPAPQ